MFCNCSIFAVFSLFLLPALFVDFRDVIETVRKLYLVTVVCDVFRIKFHYVRCVLIVFCFVFRFGQVAFFASGSMLQIVLSILISVVSFAYHVFALPYKENWLNSTSTIPHTF